MISPTKKLSLYNNNKFSLNLPPLPLVQVSVNIKNFKANEGEKKNQLLGRQSFQYD